MHELIKDIFTTFNDHYHKVGDYSVTDLIAPPRIVALKNRYPECEKEISMIQSTASLIGTGVHKYVEFLLKPWDSKYSLEQTLRTGMLKRVLSGTYDVLVRNKDLFDIKTCKTWKLIFDPDMAEWIEQQNIYKWLLEINGVNVESLNILAVFLDWQEGMLVRSKTYPREPMQIFPLPIWSTEQTEEFVTRKLTMHLDCEDLLDDDLPACTPEEMWQRFPEGVSEKYAVMKSPTAKRAARVLTTKTETRRYCKETKGIDSNSFVEVRYAQRTRCERYCKVNSKCNYYNMYMRAKTNESLYDSVPMDSVINGGW